jgi:redox-sensing transcriptional repressor
VGFVNKVVRKIPDATVARLPLYHRALLELAKTKSATVSSDTLADLTAVNAAKVRKDLSFIGTYGTRGVGYDVENLLRQIGRELGLTENWPVVIVGIGNLGQALASYGGFSARGFRIAALLDADPKKTGLEVGNLKVRPTGELGDIVQKHAVAIGIIATPGHAAQTVADQMVEAGIASILNFSPSVINVPDSVAVRRVDLAVELQILSFYQHHRDDEPIPTVPVVGSVSVAQEVPRPAAGGSAGSSAGAGARGD